ncbi:polysaccharide deacetylase family protein [Bacillus pseudomycoides]|uniref:polysaccharide deacetylase family protein n=1 Tax=Bacillus pseudomycoides TaxID=64104 RepID=UPI003D2362A9
MHNGIRMTTLVKRALLICVGVLFLYEAMYGPTHIARASTGDETKSVQLVSEIQTALAPKEAPKQYNGQVRKVAYLTFDDGPGKYTAELLEMLKKEDAKATFFLIGANVKAFPDLVKQELAEGHYVDEMKEDQGLIAGIIGKSPILTRPPYGSMPGLNEALRNKVAEGGFKVWDWTIDSLDWRYNKMPVDAASAQIVQNVLAGATNPIEVVLMHDIHPQSVKAVPGIIKGLKEKGYELESYQEDEHFPLNFWHDKRM